MAIGIQTKRECMDHLGAALKRESAALKRIDVLRARILHLMSKIEDPTTDEMNNGSEDDWENLDITQRRYWFDRADREKVEG